MKIPTKQICSNSNLSEMTYSQTSSHRRERGGVATLAAIGLAIALTACGGSPTAEQPSTGQPTTEATQPTDAMNATLFVEDGVAIAGADPVAYFTEEAYVPGSAEFTHEWQGTTWQFSSAENRDLFAANPEEYAPEYGGYCAWAVAAKNQLVPIDPEAWSVVDGQLYLNANQKVKSNWLKDVPGFIAQANENWPSLSES